jgi:hypothetical protein
MSHQVSLDIVKLTINFVLVVTEDNNRRRRLLQTFEEVQHLGFLLDVFNFLNDLFRR